MQLKPGKYQHYKGNFYQVIAIAKHSETQEEFVVYKALYDNPVSKYWIRPYKMFTDTVKKDGQKLPRFKYIGKELYG
jgi:hypothetical protein